jgi:ribonuclease HI
VTLDSITLQALAFHRELVESRRLVKRDDVSLADALEQVLSANAGKQGLNNLLEARRQQLIILAEMKEKKRQLAQQKHDAKQAKKAIPASTWCAWFDGSARPNPGTCAIGVVLRAPDGREWQLSRLIGYGNSSVAEYQALIALLKMAIAQEASNMVIYGDSRVVIDDLNPRTKDHAQGLADLRQQAKELLQQIHGASLQWIPRARNQQADMFAQRAFDTNILVADAIVGAKEIRTC